MIMPFNEFQEKVRSEIKDWLPDSYSNASISILPVVKTGTEYTGMTVMPQGVKSGYTVNLDQCYRDYRNHRPMDVIFHDIARIITMTAPELPDEDLLASYPWIKERLFLRVSSAKGGENLIRKAPVLHKGDLLLTVHAQVFSSDGDKGSMLITRQILEGYDISEYQLFHDAFENSPKLMPFHIDISPEKVGRTNAEMFRDMKRENGFCTAVISSPNNSNGAASLFYEGIMEQIAEDMDSSYFVMPFENSMMLLLDDPQEELGVVDPMHREILKFCLGTCQVPLSNLHHYDRDTRIFETETSYERRTRQIPS